MSAFDHFDFLAPHYDRFFHLHHRDRLIEILGLPIQGLLLDAGGGTGRVAQALRSHVRNVIVADISRGMLRHAAAKENLQVVCAPSEKLPFPDGSFDRIIMVDALHHVYSASESANELWRVLKPGGRLVIEEPDIRTLAVKIVAIVEKLALMRSHFVAPPTIASFFAASKAKTIVQRDGYTSWIVIDKEELPVS